MHQNDLKGDFLLAVLPLHCIQKDLFIVLILSSVNE